jgi:hypothetical protein
MIPSSYGARSLPLTSLLSSSRPSYLSLYAHSPKCLVLYWRRQQLLGDDVRLVDPEDLLKTSRGSLELRWSEKSKADGTPQASETLASPGNSALGRYTAGENAPGVLT